MPIRYRIFNVGSSAAFDVTLEDEWSSEEFESVSGIQAGSWAKIAVGANISHIVVVRPYSYGYKTSSPAKVTYRTSADSDDVQVAFSNDLGLIPVQSSKDEDKLSDPHMTEWLAFLLGAAALAFVPLLICRPPAPQDGSKKAKKA